MTGPAALPAVPATLPAVPATRTARRAAGRGLRSDETGGRRESRASTVAKIVGSIALVAFAVFPAYWMLTTALDADAATRGSRLVPTSLTGENFARVFTDGDFGRFILNSVVVATATVAISAVVSLLAAVAVARFRFRFRTAILVMILIVQMVPLEALVIPLFLQARTLQMLNSLLGLVIVYLAFSLPFAIWTLRGFVAAVPQEIEEAAYMDGASWGRMFRSVLLPLVAPGLVATSIFAFITAWNEFIFALTFMQDSELYTVSVGLRTFFGQNTNDWGAIMAASSIITVPVVVFFVLIQRRMTSGLASGAVKG